MVQDDDVGRSARGRLPDGAPNPVDVHVGSRVRLRRMLLGLSQERLGDALGLTFQQVQKYERGINRIGASRLWDLSRVLGAPVGYFFENMNEVVARSSPRQLVDGTAGDGEGPGFVRDMIPPDPADPQGDIGHREVLELVRAYSRITDPVVRRRIYDLTRTLAVIPGLGLPGLVPSGDDTWSEEVRDGVEQV